MCFFSQEFLEQSQTEGTGCKCHRQLIEKYFCMLLPSVGNVSKAEAPDALDIAADGKENLVKNIFF